MNRERYECVKRKPRSSDMEQWLKDAKELARSEAKDFIKDMTDIASKYDLEPEWFIEEVVKNIHQIKNTDNKEI